MMMNTITITMKSILLAEKLAMPVNAVKQKQQCSSNNAPLRIELRNKFVFGRTLIYVADYW